MDMENGGVLIPNRERNLRGINHDKDEASSWELHCLWRFLWLLFHYGFLITLGALLITKYVSVNVWFVSPIVYLSVAIFVNKFLLKLYLWITKLLQVLDRSNYAVNIVAAATRELVVTSAEGNELLQLVICLQACSFIVYLRAVTGGDRCGLIRLLSNEFSRTASGFFYNGEIFSGIFFAIPTSIAILALVINVGKRPSAARVLDQVLDIIGDDLEETPE